MTRIHNFRALNTLQPWVFKFFYKHAFIKNSRNFVAFILHRTKTLR